MTVLIDTALGREEKCLVSRRWSLGHPVQAGYLSNLSMATMARYWMGLYDAESTESMSVTAIGCEVPAHAHNVAFGVAPHWHLYDVCNASLLYGWPIVRNASIRKPRMVSVSLLADVLEPLGADFCVA
jgi:hypothetical protein